MSVPADEPEASPTSGALSSAAATRAVPLTEVTFHHSAQLPDVLEKAGCSLLVSTYQAGQLVAVGVADGQLNLAFRGVERAMGIAVGADRIAVGGQGVVWTLLEHSGLAAAMAPSGRHDRCWLPRTALVTGGIQCHEVAWGRGESGEPELWVVNTLFSCLATLDPRYSFVPRWQPPYISELAPQDRCHLNGVAMRDGSPAFVTAMAQTDAPGGWRSNRNETGVVLDVASGEPVTTGLSMPHSPRWYDGNLFVLNSGLGRLERVDVATGQRDVVATVPGYARGLAFHGGLAFVGLSRIRETTTFGGTPISAYADQLKCGVGVIEVGTGTTVATLQFANGVEEIFDVQALPGVRCPSLGAAGDQDEVWVLPDSH